MDINELLHSTYRLGTKRQPSYVFSQKSFGKVYAFNKLVTFKKDSPVIEISMYISTSTEKNKTAHRVDIALLGIDFKILDLLELINLIKLQSNYSGEDTDKILEDIYNGKKIFKGKTIIPSRNNTKKFVVIEDRISLKTKVRVRCSCSDYYYTFGFYNFENKVHIGQKPPKYYKVTRKESDSLVPKRNPKRIPGACKHLLLFFTLLMNDRILNSSIRLTKGYKGNVNKIDIISRKNLKKYIRNVEKELLQERKDRRLR